MHTFRFIDDFHDRIKTVIIKVIGAAVHKISCGRSNQDMIVVLIANGVIYQLSSFEIYEERLCWESITGLFDHPADD